jgi:hypothetical protein
VITQLRNEFADTDAFESNVVDIEDQESEMGQRLCGSDRAGPAARRRVD